MVTRKQPPRSNTNNTRWPVVLTTPQSQPRLTMNLVLSRCIGLIMLLALGASAKAGATFTPLGALPGGGVRQRCHRRLRRRRGGDQGLVLGNPACRQTLDHAHPELGGGYRGAQPLYHHVPRQNAHVNQLHRIFDRLDYSHPMIPHPPLSPTGC